jgi:hypothetical protein
MISARKTARPMIIYPARPNRLFHRDESSLGAVQLGELWMAIISSKSLKS